MQQIDHLSDEALVQKSLEDVEFFGVLVERYEEKLLRYILRLSSFSVEEAEEILQEVFLKLWVNLREFDGSLKFSSFIYRIAHNQTISAWRKAESRGASQQQELDEGIYEILPDACDLVEEVHATINAAKVRAILENLPADYRQVLVLRYLEDQSYEAISDILKKPSGTVATLLSRAKTAFRQAADRKNLSPEPS